MIKIRNNTFETNSSSTHSIAIPKKHMKEYPNFIRFDFDDFGWAFKDVNPANYLYTAIYCCYENEMREEKLAKLKSALDKYNVRYKFANPSHDKWGFCSGSIDHDYELREFLDKVFESDETLLDFIFSGMLFTGNDNCDDDEYNFVNRNKPTYIHDEYTEEDGKWEHVKTETLPNPYYTSEYENYDWIVKGN